jgi:hypothetical protein
MPQIDSTNVKEQSKRLQRMELLESEQALREGTFGSVVVGPE